MPPTRIAIAIPNPDAWSETFIAAHVRHLPEIVLTLTNGVLPNTANGHEILQARPRLIRMAALLERTWRTSTWPDLIRKAITRELIRSECDVLLAEFGPTGAELLPCARAAGVPMVVHFHGIDAHGRQLLRKYGDYQELVQEAAAIIVVSREMEEQLLRLGAPRKRLHYICYGIDVDQFALGAPDQAPPRFLSVGRFTDKKAPTLTLLAFHKAWLQKPDMRLTMAGTGVLHESVRQLRKALGLDDVVDLPGVLAPQQVAAAMHACRAFVQHSVTTADNDKEGTPLAVLEAMASGSPVVATRHAGIGDVVEHERSGLLCEEYDIQTMAEHLLLLANNSKMAADMGKAGRAYVERNNRVEIQVGALRSVLEQVAAEDRRTR